MRGGKFPKLLGTRESSFRHSGIRKDRREGMKRKEIRQSAAKLWLIVREGSETIMGSSLWEHGIVHAIRKRMG